MSKLNVHTEKRHGTELPLLRVKTIMKSSPGVEHITQESLHLVTKATELFIKTLVNDSHSKCKGKLADYDSIAEVVHENDALEFLRELIPKKITFQEYLKKMAKKGVINVSSSEEDDDVDVEEEEEEDDDSSDGDRLF